MNHYFLTRRFVFLLFSLFALIALVCASQAGATTWSRSVSCPSPMRPFVQSLTALETQVQVGVNFTTYKNYLTRAETAYNSLPVADESFTCVNAVGIPGEHALNDYIGAYNDWASCLRSSLSKLYTGGAPIVCTNPGAPGYGSEQVFWGRASAAVQVAVNELG